MSRNLILGTSALALVGLAAIPARADVPAPELVIEGPIDTITADSITVMGIEVAVPTGKANTPTKLDVPLIDLTKELPGRPKGFVGGTAIVTGGSVAGKVTATEVFSDVNENVLVGEVTDPVATVEGDTRLTVNFKEMEPIPATTVIPAAKPMSVYGFEINPKTAVKGSLISIEGYQGIDGKLYYHALEADAGTPVYAGVNEVSVVRSECRDRRDANRDELQVNGYVHRAGMTTLTGTSLPTVAITYAGIDARTRAKVNVTVQANLTVDPAAPQYAAYRYNSSNRNLDGCPLKVTVAWQGDTDTQVSTTDADAAP